MVHDNQVLEERQEEKREIERNENSLQVCKATGSIAWRKEDKKEGD